MAFTTTRSCYFPTILPPVTPRNFTGHLNFSTRRIIASLATSSSYHESKRDNTTTFVANLDEETNKKSLKDYFEEAKDLIKRSSDGGAPRWFSPSDCGDHSDDSPLLLYLPGIDGVGLGLIRQHQGLGKIFDIWCLHIPVEDRTSFADLVKLVERKVRSENYRVPNRPIYIVGDSLGGLIALEVAACNQDIDLALILANPATSFRQSTLRHLFPFLELVPDQLHLHLPYALSLFTGDPLKKGSDNVFKAPNLLDTIGKTRDLLAIPTYLPVVADILPKETFLWKMKMLRSAALYVNTRLHDVKAQTLVLSSGKDQLMPSAAEGKRLCSILRKCETRNFADSGHFLFMEDDVDLVSIIKGASFYRRGKYHDYASDFLPPTRAESEKIYESHRWFIEAYSPVMHSTLEDGTIVKGLAGLPSDGPVLYISYHMLLGFDVAPLVYRVWKDRNILLRGLAHPIMFRRLFEDGLIDVSNYDVYRIMGAVPVSPNNLYKLLSSKSHVLMFPGGMREAVHRKGEQYKLFWPTHSEFVRVAATFGAKIVPFATVGEDDVGEVFFDYEDQMKFPLSRDFNEQAAQESEAIRIRNVEDGEVANQPMHSPYFLPKIPGRFYFCFGKPIETAGRKQELRRDKEKAQELYLEVKSEVEKLIDFLKEKREHDPYRNIVARLAYQATHGFTADVPSFDL